MSHRSMTMYPTYELNPKSYQRKLKDAFGKETGETEPVLQVDLPSFTTYTFDFSNCRNAETAKQKLLLAEKNGDTAKIAGSTDVKTFGNSKSYVFNVIDVDYTPKTTTK